MPEHNQFVGDDCIEIEMCSKEESKEKIHPEKDDNHNSMTCNEHDVFQIKAKRRLNDSAFFENEIAVLQKDEFEKNDEEKKCR